MNSTRIGQSTSPKQILRAKFRAGQMNAGGGQRNDFLGQRREKQADDRDENDDAFDRVNRLNG